MAMRAVEQVERVWQSVQAYFPKSIEPSKLWGHYNPTADSLTIYFTSSPVPSIWADVDASACVGFAPDDESIVTGVMIEHFRHWLLAADRRRTTAA